jgi:hypothetical protein
VEVEMVHLAVLVVHHNVLLLTLAVEVVEDLLDLLLILVLILLVLVDQVVAELLSFVTNFNSYE